MKRLTALFLALLMAAALFSGCSGGQDTKEPNSSGKPQTSEQGNAPETGGSEGSSAPQEEDGPQVYEHFTGGTLYEEGKYFFSIESMGMTNEGYEVQYTAQTDTKGYQVYCDMKPVINGIRTDFEGWTFYDDTEKGQKGSSTMLPNTAKLVIGKEYLEKMGATEVKSLALHVELGMSTGSTFTPGAELDYILYPGNAVDTAAQFPEPARESWLLYDGTHGRLQILSAAYQEDRDGCARVHAFILAQGVEDEENPYGVSVEMLRLDGKYVNFSDKLNQDYDLLPEAILYEGVLVDQDIAAENMEEGFLSPATVTVHPGYPDEEKIETVLDFTHLEYEAKD